MKKKFVILGVAGMIVLLAACRGRERDSLSFEPPVFPETKTVSVTGLPSNYLFGNNVWQMFMVHDFILLQAYSAKGYLHIFEKETGAYIKSLAPYGRGPGEFLIPPECCMSEDGAMFYVYEGKNGLNRYRSYKVEDMLQKSQPLPYKEEAIQVPKRAGEIYLGGISFFAAWQDKRFLSGTKIIVWRCRIAWGERCVCTIVFPNGPCRPM